MRFGILGRLEIYSGDGTPLDVGGAQPRLIAAALVAAGGRALSSDFLIEAIWGDDLPASPTATLQTYVSRLRRHVGADSLVWEAPGYRLVVERDEVDAWRFEATADQGRAALAAGDPAAAHELLVAAERLWRGSALPEVRDLDAFRGLASRLEERRLVAAEDRFESDLLIGRHELVAGELAEAVIAHPFREVLRRQLALALYRSGRQADALRSITNARTTFAEELGIDLGAELQRLESAILVHDPILDHALPPAVRASSGAPPGAPCGGSSASTFVGRQDELQVLTSALEHARHGHTSVVIEGVPGIGKTRLVEEFAADAARQGATVAWGGCYEGSAAPSWWPWLAILESIVDTSSSSAGRGLDELLHPSTGASVDVSPSRRFELHEAVRHALTEAARGRTLVVVLDDLQWADEASLELLGHLTRTLGEAPVLLVVTLRDLEIGRSDSVTHTLGVLARGPASTRIRLSGLDDAEIALLLDIAAGTSLPVEQATAINARAEGNPFYAIELVRDLQEGGTAPIDGANCTLPAGLADVVRQRLDRLTPAARELLHLAAVIGRDVDSSLLLRAAGRGADAFDDLEPAFSHRFLDEVGESPGWFRFTHALVREVLVDEITTLHEARLHLRVADAIEARPDLSDSDSEILAEHLYAARSLGVGYRAAVALRQAAGVAIRRSAYAAAEDRLNRAAMLLLTADGVPDRLDAELDVLVALFFAQRATRGHDAAMASRPIARARELAQIAGRTDVAARLLWAEWVGVDKAGDAERSRELAERLAALAAASGDSMIEGLSLHAKGVISWHAGDLAGSAAALDRAATLNRQWASTSRSAVQSIVTPISPVAWPRGHPIVAFVHMLIGDSDDPIAGFERIAEDDMQPFASTVVWMFAAFGALAIGDIDTAITAGRRGLEADPDLVFTYWGPGAHLALGAALAVAGELDEGLDLIARAMPRYLASGTRIFVPLVHARLAQGLSRSGRHDESQIHLHRALALADEYGERWLEPVLIAVEAEMGLITGGRSPRVTETFERAQALAIEQCSHAIARDIAATAAALTGSG
jgi:DNA-binding SARP family transcriptional activator/tetratricopeptide (TPR) repeat protein